VVVVESGALVLAAGVEVVAVDAVSEHDVVVVIVVVVVVAVAAVVVEEEDASIVNWVDFAGEADNLDEDLVAVVAMVVVAVDNYAASDVVAVAVVEAADRVDVVAVVAAAIVEVVVVLEVVDMAVVAVVAVVWEKVVMV
jgi:hypothetical protein